MNVLVACEFSGIVRDAFIKRGHNAVSCDLLPSERPSLFHIQDDVVKLLDENKFDLMIAHPPCEHLAVSGARWFVEKRKDGRQQRAIEFVRTLLDAPIDKIALENPVSIIATVIRPPDQYIQPYEFGHGDTKKTGLWLKNLPLLQPTDIVDGRSNRIHWMAPSPDRWKDRSRTYQGIADAMASQWG